MIATKEYTNERKMLYESEDERNSFEKEESQIYEWMKVWKKERKKEGKKRKNKKKVKEVENKEKNMADSNRKERN